MSDKLRKPASGKSRLPTPVTWRQGVHIVGSALWCDALRSQELCFVSSAMAIAKPQRRAGTLLTTQTTLSLLSAVARAPEAAQLVSPLGRPFFWGSLRLELFANGDLPGSASLWVKLPSDERVIYAGQPSELLSSLVEPMQLRPAETLVLSAPWAQKLDELPTVDELCELIHHERALATAQGVPLLIRCSSLSKLCELLPKLQMETVKAHAGLTKALRFCEALPGAKKLTVASSRSAKSGEILLWPLSVSPPALPLAPRQFWVSDGLGRNGLVRYARGTGAKRVFLLSGHCQEVAAALAKHRIACEQLGPPTQLGLFADAATQ